MANKLARAAAVVLGILGSMLVSGCRSIPDDGREATSLLGRPLWAPPRSETEKAKQESDVAAAREAYAAAPTEENAIWVGRRLGYAGRFREAIAAYTDGLSRFPESHRLLRHRGHRHITVREFGAAVKDLSRAWSLAKNRPDAVEPDGQPAAGGKGPRGTDKTNILYHLGLAHYLKGDFARAVEVFARRRELEHVNDDNLVSSLHWEYMALRRLGRDADAAALVKEVREGMDVRENASYYALVRMYAGLLRLEDVRKSGGENKPASVGARYGLANWRLYAEKDRAAAIEEFRKIVDDKPEENWGSFGYVAAEAELARMEKR